MDREVGGSHREAAPPRTPGGLGGGQLSCRMRTQQLHEPARPSQRHVHPDLQRPLEHLEQVLVLRAAHRPLDPHPLEILREHGHTGAASLGGEVDADEPCTHPTRLRREENASLVPRFCGVHGAHSSTVGMCHSPPPRVPDCD